MPRTGIAWIAESALVFCLCMPSAVGQEKSIGFSGREWMVKDGGKMGPGPNDWSSSCMFVGEKGWLHLKIAQRDSATSNAATHQPLAVYRQASDRRQRGGDRNQERHVHSREVPVEDVPDSVGS